MSYVKPDDWQPSTGILIEGKALEIVKSNVTMSILAGPGSGKTELLAQRATYLLTTGLCPPPCRILAISFKVDAARNLHDRVSSRCDHIQAQRFESFTLDAFAKKIVDQFLEALPNQLRPTPDYKIIFPNRNIWQDFGDRYCDSYPTIRQKNNRQLEELVHKSIPNLHLEDATTEEEKIHFMWWHNQIQSAPSCLTFDMIKLLAIYILKNQDCILSSLRNTYSHVFLDEFQDVTGRQYSLIKTAFLGSVSILTAVGDSNQAIMRWAGARRDIFDQFEADFLAKDERLLFNFRSNARIVELINNLAAKFDEDYISTDCARKNEPVPDDAVQGWKFDTRKDEGKFIASYIADKIRQNPSLTPADFVILARLRVNDIENRIKEEFHSQGLVLRNDARIVGGIAIQDLVKEKAYLFLLASLKLSVNVRDGQPFHDCRNTIADVRGSDLYSDKGHSNSLNAVREIVRELEQITNGKTPKEITGRELTDCILSHIDRVELQRTYREYIGGERLNSVISGFEALFDECREGSLSWYDCISDMEGDNSIRLMTIHKSKGLEYHTVIFVELNDDAFWGNDDDANVFFVALSRAKERVCFSATLDSRGNNNVEEFYNNLKDSGVCFEKM